MSEANLFGAMASARRSRRGLLLLVSAVSLAAAGRTGAQPAAVEKPRESLVKAAFLHKFASFVEWPAGTFPQLSTHLRIAIIGDDQVWRDLRELARDRDRDGRPVDVERLSPGESLSGFHIAYLKASTPARITELISHAPEGVLTIADSDGAHPRGSVLSFFLDDGRVRFGVSPEAAARQKLRLDRRLLSIARTVQGAAPARRWPALG
ncbi:YfiR family protein [Ramlibacter sp.]|uniref:YfiR family protein n=1 Tax=Ramlibacter sp. TaxID=1917967 RepID=UPI003D1463B2